MSIKEQIQASEGVAGSSPHLSPPSSPSWRGVEGGGLGEGVCSHVSPFSNPSVGSLCKIAMRFLVGVFKR